MKHTAQNSTPALFCLSLSMIIQSTHCEYFSYECKLCACDVIRIMELTPEEWSYSLFPSFHPPIIKKLIWCCFEKMMPGLRSETSFEEQLLRGLSHQWELIYPIEHFKWLFWNMQSTCKENNHMKPRNFLCDWYQNYFFEYYFHFYIFLS